MEAGHANSPEARAALASIFDPYLNQPLDGIVLGCTHYPFLLDVMKKVAPEGIRFIDPAPAVARQLLKVMDIEVISHGPVNEGGSPERPAVELLSSGDTESLRKMFDRIEF